MSTRKTYRIEELAEKIGIGPFGSSIKVDTFVDNGIPVISGNHLKGIRLEDNDFNFITIEHADKLKNANVKRGDVIFTHAGNIGAVAFIPQNSKYERYILSQRQFYMRCKTERLLPEYITYYFKTPFGQKQLLANASSVGVPSIAQPVTYLRSIEVEIPGIEEQEKVVALLNSLENKIELNLQMNLTLEIMAQAIFKQWFYEFEFPNTTNEFHNDLPIGWKIIKLNEVISIKHGFAFKGEFFSEDETENILLTPGNFKIGGGFNDNKFKYYLGDIPEEYVLEKNDLVITMTDLSKAGDTLGYPALVPEILNKKLLHNQRLGKVQFKKDDIKYYLYQTMRQAEYRHFILGTATGSTVKHTSPTRICDYEIILPAINVIEAFENVTKPLFDRIQENLIENQILANLRNSLTPNLIRGKYKFIE